MTFATYDPKEVHLILDGIPVTGFADGTFIKVTFDENQWNKKTGADGHTARAKSNNYAGTVTATLMGTSSGNDVLNALWQRDRRNNTGKVDMLVRDMQGRTVWSSKHAWVQKMPDQTYGKEVENREWVLDCANLVGAAGGNDNLVS